MDPPAADPPCIIQALPASSGALPSPPLVQALPALHSPAAKDHAPAAALPSSRPPNKRRTPPPTAPPPPPGPAPPSPRRTRSGGAPEWTPAETLALVAEVASVDDGWSRSVSAFQKWAMVAENLAASEASARRGTKRAAAECRRRWEALAAEYGAVRRWEVRTGGGYWEIGAAARRRAGLPAEFDAEVYGAMDALIRVEEALLANAAGGCGAGAGEEVEGLVGGGAGVEVGEEDGGEAEVGEDEVKEDELVDEAQEDESESADEEEDEDGREEDEEEMQPDAGNADASNTFEECETAETNNETENSQNIAWELANKLQENAQHIHTILNEEAGEYAEENHALAISPDAMETARQKADELIKSLGGLLGYLNQFTELIKESGFENVGMT